METNYKQVAQLLAWLTLERYGSLVDKNDLVAKISDIFGLDDDWKLGIKQKEKTDEDIDVIHSNDPDV